MWVRYVSLRSRYAPTPCTGCTTVLRDCLWATPSRKPECSSTESYSMLPKPIQNSSGDYPRSQWSNLPYRPRSGGFRGSSLSECRSCQKRLSAVWVIKSTSANLGHQSCGISRDFYLCLRERGKPGKVAAIAVALNLLIQLNAVTCRGTPWAKRHESDYPSYRAALA